MDHQENLWIGTYHSGVGVLKKGDNRIISYDRENGLTNDYIRCIRETPEGTILIGTFNGMNELDPRTGEITRYQTYDISQGTLNHYSIYSLFFDRSRTLWVGTYAGGINYHSNYGDKFRFYDPGSSLKQITGIMGAMVQTDRYLYIATKGGGLLEMDLGTEEYRLYPLTRRQEDGYAHNIIKSLYRDGDRILCGTNAGTIYSFDLRTRNFSLFYDFKKKHAIYYLGKTFRGEWIIGGVNEVGMTLLDHEKRVIEDKTSSGAGQLFSYFYDVRVIYEIEENIFWWVPVMTDFLFVTGIADLSNQPSIRDWLILLSHR